MNDTFTHTKGKWTCEEDEKSSDTYTLSVYPKNPVFGETKHNARLIESAPELLEATINLQKRLEQLIHLTPTGEGRNAMCDENIRAMTLINTLNPKLYPCTQLDSPTQKEH